VTAITFASGGHVGYPLNACSSNGCADELFMR
jgi:hypothetical protein